MTDAIQIFGKKYIPDGRVKRLLRKSPEPNWRAKLVGKCARDATTQKERKDCFSAKYTKPRAGVIKTITKPVSLEQQYRSETGKSAKRGRGYSIDYKKWKEGR